MYSRKDAVMYFKWSLHSLVSLVHEPEFWTFQVVLAQDAFWSPHVCNGSKTKCLRSALVVPPQALAEVEFARSSS